MKQSTTTFLIVITGLVSLVLIFSTPIFLVYGSLLFIPAMIGGAALFVYSLELEEKQTEQKDKERIHNLKNNS